jgi:hypothetical protein
MLFMLPLSALPAVADTAQLTLTALSNNSAGAYTYPYVFTVNATTNVPLMCDTFQNQVQSGDSWTANVFPLLSAGTSGNGLFSSLPNSQQYNQQLYDAAGLIYLGVLGQGPLANYAGLSNTALGSWAIWDLFDPGTSQLQSSGVIDPYSTADLTALDQVALANVGDTTDLANVVVYTPVNGQVGGSSPQEFIGVVPEPATLALMAAGLLSCGGIVRRKRRP